MPECSLLSITKLERLYNDVTTLYWQRAKLKNQISYTQPSALSLSVTYPEGYCETKGVRIGPST